MSLRDCQVKWVSKRKVTPPIPLNEYLRLDWAERAVPSSCSRRSPLFPSLTAALLPTPVSYTDVHIPHTFSYRADLLCFCPIVHACLLKPFLSHPIQLLQKLFDNQSESFKKSNNLNLYVIEYDTTGCVPNDLYLFLGFKNSAKRCGMSKKNPLQTTLEVWLRKWKWFMGDSKSVGVTLQNARRSLTQRCGILCVCLAGWGNVTILWGGRQAQTEIQKDKKTNK